MYVQMHVLYVRASVCVCVWAAHSFMLQSVGLGGKASEGCSEMQGDHSFV